jgi:WD40 repeat protein
LRNHQATVADVFISYSRRDGSFVRGLHAFLTSTGRDVWVDWEDIPPASEWERDIHDSIDAAESFVFVASPSSLDSKYCADELHHAEERGKRIVPLAIDGAAPRAAPAALRQLNWIWCREADDRDTALAALTSALDTDLEWSHAHTRMLVRAVEWDARGDGSLLLRGKDLAQAERVLAENAGKDPRPTELQERYLHASRRAARRRQRALLGGVSVALAVAVGLGIAALLQRNTAIRERNSAQSLVLANAADGQRGSRLDVALLLGLEANRLKPSVEARSSMVSSLEALEETGATAILRTDSPVGAVALSPDGKALAAGEENGDITLWDLQDHRQQPGPPLHNRTGEVTSLAFSGERDLLVTGDKTLHVRLWNLSTRQPSGDAMRMPATKWADGITGLSFSPDDRTVASVDADQVMLWDVSNDQLDSHDGRALRLEDPDFVLDATFSPDGRTLARLLPGSVDLWNVRYDDIAASSKLRDNGIDTGQAHTVAVSRGRHTVAAAGDGPVSLWSLRLPHRPSTVQPGHAGNLLAIAFDPDAGTLATGGDDNTVRLSDVPAASTNAPLGPDPNTMAVGFARDGRLLAGGSVFNATRVWASRGPHLSDVRVGGVSDLAFTPDGKLGLATGNTRGIAQIWNVSTGQVVHELDAQPLSVAAFSPDGSRAVTGSDAGEARVWNVMTGERLHVLPRGDGAISSVAFTPDGKFVVTGAEHGRARLWDVATGEKSGRVFDAHESAGDVYSVAFSADGKYLITGNSDGTARIWTVHDRRQVGEPLRAASHGYGVVRVAFSPDGQAVATGNGEQVQLWDVASHQPLGGSLDGDAVAFSRDGRSLAVASPMGQTARLWKRILWRNIDDLRARVCGIVWRDLTTAEWATYAPGLPPRASCAS